MKLVLRCGRAILAFVASALIPAVAHARTLEAIQSRGVLSVCAHANALPFASRSHSPPGFQIEIASALARELGVGLEVAWVTILYQRSAVNCDIVLDAIVGDVDGKNAIVLDDEIANGGTIVEVLQKLRERGAKRIVVATGFETTRPFESVTVEGPKRGSGADRRVRIGPDHGPDWNV